uniref:Uncharacterized protein n=1 Tax=Anguilla anguilla TaxID=7936 RepID=A0A0E9RIL7_ANGAN
MLKLPHFPCHLPLVSFSLKPRFLNPAVAIVHQSHFSLLRLIHS